MQDGAVQPPKEPRQEPPGESRGEPPEEPRVQLPLDLSVVRRAVEAGIDRYMADRRARIEPFIDRNFALAGAWDLNRRAFGWDLLRAPANMLLAVPVFTARSSALAARRARLARLADRLDGWPRFVETDVARELEWRLFSDLLELPYAQAERRFERDALAEAILADPTIAAALRVELLTIGRRAEDPRFRAWLTEAMQTYTDSRPAATELANALLSVSSGALLLKQWTPGALSLGPALANLIATKLAVASFPLGTGIGGLWYGVFPAAAPLAASAAMTGGLIGIAAMVSAFAGVVTDPLQRRLGLHRRRLDKLLVNLEAALRDERPRYSVPDHYVARVLDLFDLLTAASRLAR